MPGILKPALPRGWTPLGTHLCSEIRVFACRAGPKTLARGPAWHFFAAFGGKEMVGGDGFEPPTLSV